MNIWTTEIAIARNIKAIPPFQAQSFPFNQPFTSTIMMSAKIRYIAPHDNHVSPIPNAVNALIAENKYSIAPNIRKHANMLNPKGLTFIAIPISPIDER